MAVLDSGQVGAIDILLPASTEAWSGTACFTDASGAEIFYGTVIGAVSSFPNNDSRLDVVVPSLKNCLEHKITLRHMDHVV